nr:RNA-directed DNA polymerase, eukaryota [Tanacetum cinerariifolium]
EVIKVSDTSDLIRPPGFKHVKRSSLSTSKCSTNIARHQKKDIKGLIDLLIGGRYYTWMNKASTKLNKIDRFLISEGILEDIPDIRVTAVDPPNDGRILRSHEKLRCLKTAIKQWNSNTRNNDHTLKQVALYDIKDIEKNIDDGSSSSLDRDKRIKLPQDINKLNKLQVLDLIQKSHIKWDIKGDENSKFFHWMINNKMRSQAITGILHDGVWISDPLLIKEAFLNYYKDKFQVHDSQVFFSPMIHYTSLISHDRDSLETHFSLHEIKTAVWDCGSNKAPGPDGFSFAFIKKYWDLIKTNIFEFVNSFFVLGSMPEGANSSIFTLISKTSNPISIKDFCLISLIGIHYKIIAKVLAN